MIKRKMTTNSDEARVRITSTRPERNEAYVYLSTAHPAGGWTSEREYRLSELREIVAFVETQLAQERKEY